MKFLNKIFGLLLIFVLMSGYVVCEDTYISAINNVHDQIIQSEQNIKKDIDSFQGAFTDTFKLIDDEISRLIFANAAMVGLVFAINFLVYAKTSTRSRRDLQVLLVAHAKHMDNMVSSRLDDFTRNIGAMMEERKKQDMSTLESLDDQIKGVVSSDLAVMERKQRIQDPARHETKTSLQENKQTRQIANINSLITEDEGERDADGKVLIPKKSSGPGFIFFKRIKLGVLRVLGRKSHKEKVDEFRLK